MSDVQCDEFEGVNVMMMKRSERVCSRKWRFIHRATETLFGGGIMFLIALVLFVEANSIYN